MALSRMTIRTVAICVLITFFSCSYNNKVEIRGIYGHPKPFWEKGIHLPDMGINAIFVHSGSINDEMMQRAEAEGLKVYAEFATLNGKNYVQDHPEAWAIDDSGERVEAASWFMGVCPTNSGFRDYRRKQLRHLLEAYDLDGVWMDYVHWHAQFEEPEPMLPETCFCDHCLRAFSLFSDIEIPVGPVSERADWILKNADPAWRKWRCHVIYEWAAEFRSIVKQSDPEMLLGLYHCPWNDVEFDSARIRILGLDYDLLKGVVDVFSPMVYHGRMGREPEWVAENISWTSERLNIQNGMYPKVWPIVQAHDDPGTISGVEFETVLKGGLAGKSSGVMMFTTNAMAGSEAKTEVMKNLYLEIKKKSY